MVRAVPRCFLYRYYTVADTYHNPIIARNKCLALCRTLKSQTAHYSAPGIPKMSEKNPTPSVRLHAWEEWGKVRALLVGRESREVYSYISFGYLKIFKSKVT